MKKVLILTYYWPPSGGSGVQRWLKFTKYLPGFGWKPYVVTPGHGSYPTLDRSLLKDISEETEVYKTPTLEPFRLYNLLRGKPTKSVDVGMIGFRSPGLLQRVSLFIRANFFIPDARIGWNYFAYRKALEIILRENIEVVITTGPPQSTHLVGLKLKQKLPGLKWVADFRDPWVNIYYNKYMPRMKWAKELDQKLENSVLKAATSVITVSKGLKEEFEDRSSDIRVIYNGYDESDLIRPEVIPTVRFVMLFVGNFIPFSNSSGLWSAIQQLQEEEMDFKKDFELNFTGRVDSSVLEELKKNNIYGLARVNPFVDHDQINSRMFEACLLLFVVPKEKGNKLILTGKLFEYLASTTPILSIGPVDGDAAFILEEAERDRMSDYEDTESIKKVLLKYYHRWKADNKKPYKHITGDFRKFSRKNLSAELANCLNEL